MEMLSTIGGIYREDTARPNRCGLGIKRIKIVESYPRKVSSCFKQANEVISLYPLTIKYLQIIHLRPHKRAQAKK
jgi:hypothetical protein